MIVEEVGSSNDGLGRKRPAAATSSQNVKHVRERLRRDRKRSLRRMVQAIGVSKASTSRNVNEKLGLSSYR